MEFRELNTFLQVAQHLSFSHAAKQLGYSQSAVTIQIKQLERELGVHLFDRIGRQISLTHQGRIFYEYAVSIDSDVRQAKAAVADAGDASRISGKLCLGTIESICASLFPAMIEEYHRRCPDVSISIITDSPDVLLDMMNKNIIDIVYLLDRRIYDAKWCKTLEIPERNIFVASHEHPLAKLHRELDIKEVLAYPILLTEKNASYRYTLEQYLASEELSVSPYLEIGNTDFIIRMLLKNMGISFLPEFTICNELNDGRLTELKIADFEMRTWRQIFYHKDKWITAQMREFLRLAGELG